jgi:hypothetical protein
MLTTLKSKAPDLTSLEAAVSTATQQLVTARLALDGQQRRLDAIEAALRDDRNSDALTTEQAEAEHTLRDMRVAVRKQQNELRTAEHDLDLARTTPLRKTNAAQLRRAADDLAKALPGARDFMTKFVGVIDAAAFPDVGGGELLVSWIRSTAAALAGPDGEAFVRALRQHADGIESGERPAGLRPTTWPN